MSTHFWPVKPKCWPSQTTFDLQTKNRQKKLSFIEQVKKKTAPIIIELKNKIEYLNKVNWKWSQ